MNEFFSIFREYLPVITVGGTVVSAAGLIPRMGPGRAIWIALRSRFAFKPKPESLRMEEIKLLRTVIMKKNFGQSYIIVTGEKGVGKTCLLNTVLSKTPGVIRVKVPPGEREGTIIKNTLEELSDPLFKFINPVKMAKRVIFWYQCITFGRSPIVVMNASERKFGEEYAGLTGAVRTLVDDYKLRVIVDGSPNSLDETLLRTKRQIVFEIKPMNQEMIWNIEQLEDLFNYVKEAGLEDIVFAVLGRIPADYCELWNKTQIDLQAGQDARKVIGNYLCAAILDAINHVQNSISQSIHMKEMVKLLDKEKMSIRRATLIDNNLQRPTPDKVFCVAERDNVSVLIPASNSIGIVLKHGLYKKPSLKELEKLLKN